VTRDPWQRFAMSARRVREALSSQAGTRPALQQALPGGRRGNRCGGKRSSDIEAGQAKRNGAAKVDAMVLLSTLKRRNGVLLPTLTANSIDAVVHRPTCSFR